MSRFRPRNTPYGYSATTDRIICARRAEGVGWTDIASEIGAPSGPCVLQRAVVARLECAPPERLARYLARSGRRNDPAPAAPAEHITAIDYLHRMTILRSIVRRRAVNRALFA